MPFMYPKYDVTNKPRNHDANDKGLWFEFILLFFLLSSAMTQKGWTPVRRSISKSKTDFFQKHNSRVRARAVGPGRK